MKKLLFVWHDRDGSHTTHEFGSPETAEPWLRSVLQDSCPAEELEAGGYTLDGVGMYHLYLDQGFDDVGTIELFIGGVGASPADLYG